MVISEGLQHAYSYGNTGRFTHSSRFPRHWSVVSSNFILKVLFFTYCLCVIYSDYLFQMSNIKHSKDRSFYCAVKSKDNFFKKPPSGREMNSYWSCYNRAKN